jgi:hypothetical protein
MPLDANRLADGFERYNAALEEQAHGLMTQVVADQSLHARLANTLAMLGHLGGHHDEAVKLLAGHAVRDYVQGLEAAVAEAMPHSEHKSAHDLAVAMVTQFRAGWTHRLHRRALGDAGHASAEGHGYAAGLAGRLRAIKAKEHHIHQLGEIESRLYEKLLAAFVNAAATMPSSVETGLTALGRMVQ